MRTALTIAGSDCSGGAGIQADIKTFCAHGVYAMSAITAIVAENTAAVLRVQAVSPDMVAAQLRAVFEDIRVHAVKIGMLPNADCVYAVADALCAYSPAHVVLDPVLCATTGNALAQPQTLQALLERLLPLASVVTPNLPEVRALTGRAVTDAREAQAAAAQLLGAGAGAVLVKGGHASGDQAVDLLYDPSGCRAYAAPRIHTHTTHGTGCTYSSAIAANLALGHSLPQAVRRAKTYVTGAIRHGLSLGRGHGPTNHFYEFFCEDTDK